MIIVAATIFIIVMTMFSYYYTKKILLDEAEAVIKKKYFFLICFLGGVLGKALFLLSYYIYEDSLWYCVKLLFAYEILLTAALIDYKLQIIPNTLILVLLLAGVSCAIVEIVIFQFPAAVLIKDYLLGAAFGGGIFLLATLFVRNGVGMGDVKLFGVLGLLLGWEVIFNLLFFSVLISAGYGIALLIRKKADKKVLLPLAPFAYIGMIILLMLGV